MFQISLADRAQATILPQAAVAMDSAAKVLAEAAAAAELVQAVTGSLALCSD